jgi:membrane fusion protein, multidrug efflux system
MTYRLALCGVSACLGVSMALAAPATTGQDLNGVTTCLIQPKQIVQLGSPVAGLLAEVLVDRGATVKAGQVVAKLESSVEEVQVEIDRIQARNTSAIEAAQVERDYNELEVKTKQPLADQKLVRANEVERHRAAVAQAEIAIRKGEMDLSVAALEARRSERLLSLKQIKSPVSGVVTERKLSPGEHVYEQTPILTLAEINPLYVELVVSAQYYKQFKVGMTAQVRLSEPVGGTYTVRADVVDPVIDPASNTFRVRLVLPNPTNAIPAGLHCSVQLPRS